MTTTQNGPQTLGEYLAWAANLLRERIIETPQLDAELLLDELRDLRAYIVSHSRNHRVPIQKNRQGGIDKGGGGGYAMTKKNLGRRRRPRKNLRIF